MTQEAPTTNVPGFVHPMNYTGASDVARQFLSSSPPPSSPSSSTSGSAPGFTPAALAALCARIQMSSRSSAPAAPVKPTTNPVPSPPHLMNAARPRVNAALIDRLRADMRAKATFRPCPPGANPSTPAPAPPPPERRTPSPPSGWLPTSRIAGVLCAHQGCNNEDLAWNDTVPEEILRAGKARPMYVARSMRGDTTMVTFGLCASHYREIKVALSIFQRSNLPTEYLVSTVRALDQSRGRQETARTNAYRAPSPDQPSTSASVVQSSSTEASEMEPEIVIENTQAADVEVVGSDDEDDDSDVFEATVVTDDAPNDATSTAVAAKVSRAEPTEAAVVADGPQDEPATASLMVDVPPDGPATAPVVAHGSHDEPATDALVVDVSPRESTTAQVVSDGVLDGSVAVSRKTDLSPSEITAAQGVAGGSQDIPGPVPTAAHESRAEPASATVGESDAAKDARDEASVTTAADPQTGHAVGEARVEKGGARPAVQVEGAYTSDVPDQKSGDLTDPAASGERSELLTQDADSKLERKKNLSQKEQHGKRRLSSKGRPESPTPGKRKRRRRSSATGEMDSARKVEKLVGKGKPQHKADPYAEPPTRAARLKKRDAVDEIKSVKEEKVVEPSNDSSPLDEEEDESEADEVFAVEKLLQWKLDNRGHRKFLVKWEGYPLSEASWEPESNLNSSVEIDELKAAVLAKPPSIPRRSLHMKKAHRRI
ncbi:hypothetical protein FOZ60_006723 [Perkinsus olseni]|uniref:Chromo domain-containing protein n=3 Tax=Perkinsus olseni TaxID=32597 RepID=A0A7J6PHA3_PEROL|nr:hypothetical protein FOZ60_006723 [Perkinsus olseni]